MNKKGEGTSWIVMMFVLSIIVLLVLVAVLQSGILKPFKKVMGVAESIDRCASPLVPGRVCTDSCDQNYVEISPLADGKWDCPPEKSHCCEPVI